MLIENPGDIPCGPEEDTKGKSKTGGFKIIEKIPKSMLYKSDLCITHIKIYFVFGTASSELNVGFWSIKIHALEAYQSH